MTTFLILYVGSGLIIGSILDSIFRKFKTIGAPNRIVGIFAIAWMLPATFSALMVYYRNPEVFGYLVQNYLNRSEPPKHAQAKRLISCGVTFGLIAIIVIRLMHGDS